MKIKITTKTSTLELKLRKGIAKEVIDKIKKYAEIRPEIVEHNQNCSHILYFDPDQKYHFALSLDDSGKIRIDYWKMPPAGMCFLTTMLAMSEKHAGVTIHGRMKMEVPRLW